MQKVVSLAVSRRLDAAIRKAGVKGPECELWYIDGICNLEPYHPTGRKIGDGENLRKDWKWLCPAPDVPELMEWMPNYVELSKRSSDIFRSYGYIPSSDNWHSVESNSPANALAEIAIWLLENKPEVFATLTTMQEHG